MKNNLLSTAVCMLFAASSSNLMSQNVSVHAGINASNMHFKLVPDAISTLDTSFSLEPKVTFRIGAEYHFHFKQNVSLETGLYYSNRSRAQSFKSEFSEFEDIISMNYVEIPINVRYALPVGDMSVHLRGGMLLGLALNGSRSGYDQTTIPGLPVVRNEYDKELEIGGENQFKSFDAGYNVGIGFVFNKIMVNVNYNRSLGSIIDNTAVPDSKSTTKWGVTQVTLGYTLF